MIDEIPDDAMRVEHEIEDSDHENYVRFSHTDVIEWYTVRENGEIQKEQFANVNPDYPDEMRQFITGQLP